MKRSTTGILLGSLAAAIVASLAITTANGENGKPEQVFQPGDEDIILSTMPLSGLKAMNEGEHSANDFGPVIILVVETCNGTPI